MDPRYRIAPFRGHDEALLLTQALRWILNPAQLAIAAGLVIFHVALIALESLGVTRSHSESLGVTHFVCAHISHLISSHFIISISYLYAPRFERGS